MIITAIKDKKTGKFGMLNSIPQENMTERLIRLVFDGDNIYTRFPEDFAIYKIAEMNEETGKLKTEECPTKLIEFSMIYRKQTEEQEKEEVKK